MNIGTISCRGEKIYVGIDVHKKSYSVTVKCGTEIVARDTMRASPEGLIQYLKKRFAGAQIFSVYEAGFSGFVLHRKLEGAGIRNVVINAASVETAANDRVKTDKRDSKKLAEQLKNGTLKGIYIPSTEEESKRALTRTRDQIVAHRARVATQIKSKLHYFGMIACDDDNKPMSDAYLRNIGKKLGLSDELEYCFRILGEEWRFLTMKLKEIAGKIAEQAKGDEKLERVYRSVPGVGEISARVLANELGDLSERFRNERALFGFTGLTPGEHSSGEHVHKGRISRQGSSRLRKYLVEIAWRALRKDDALAEIFSRIAKTRGKKRAIVAIARKLIGRIRSCFRQECLYQIGICA
jgi:transposase